MPTDFGLRELQEYVPRAAERDADVSGWSVGMHIQHVSLAMVAVCQSLVASKPPAPRSGLNLVRSIVFTSGRIPRGRAKSPDPAVPSEGVTEEELRSLLAESERQLQTARAAPPDRWFRHFAFGVMERDRTLRFLEIHNRHHLRIVQDILGA
jgi:hypothetical protein